MILQRLITRGNYTQAAREQEGGRQGSDFALTYGGAIGSHIQKEGAFHIRDCSSELQLVNTPGKQSNDTISTNKA